MTKDAMTAGTPAPTGTEARVCADIAERQARGLAKYGTTVEANPLGLAQWLRHAYEETLDKAVYLRRALEQLEAEGTELARLRAEFAGYREGSEQAFGDVVNAKQDIERRLVSCEQTIQAQQAIIVRQREELAKLKEVSA